jgi:hypothetical protein
MNKPNEGVRDDVLADLSESRFRTLGTRMPRCAVPGCAETDPLALTGAHPEILCREHLADCCGAGWLEAHHLAGRRNDSATVSIPANDHGVLTASQSLWPRATLRNPEGSPLIQAAASIRGWLDVLQVIIERTVGWIPAFLETLDKSLAEQRGPGWWKQLGYES